MKAPSFRPCTGHAFDRRKLTDSQAKVCAEDSQHPRYKPQRLDMAPGKTATPSNTQGWRETPFEA
ncbi:hypothetical protein [Dyella sp. SG609]|uniref:hypothetical protein n=1 Tax=Dyella sp. SG609 TaxID=2587018 RepID=UPI0014473B19|nr:hypothetical protein [Dyella sp. SG609]NKJ21896.1 hypothetical protein [Dyella sp. SG609]